MSTTITTIAIAPYIGYDSFTDRVWFKQLDKISEPTGDFCRLVTIYKKSAKEAKAHQDAAFDAGAMRLYHEQGSTAGLIAS